MKSENRPKLPKGLARTAMQELGLAIVRGDFEAGAVLPTEEVLATRTGVSRPALREAIKVLSGKGLVRTARRYGSRVCPRGEWNLLDPDVLAWHLSVPGNWPVFLRDAVEMRVLLEPKAAMLAAERATPDEVADLLRLAARLPVINTPDAIGDDVAFHTAVMRASHNGILAGLAVSMEVLLRAYFSAIWRVRPGGPTALPPNNLHLATAEAIRDRRPADAAAAMAQMLDVNEREIDDLIRRFVPSAGERAAAGV